MTSTAFEEFSVPIPHGRLWAQCHGADLPLLGLDHDVSELAAVRDFLRRNESTP